MKRKEKQNLSQKDISELFKLLTQKRKRLQEMKFSISLGEKIKNIKEIQKVRKEIAVVLTFLNQKLRNKEIK